MNFNSEAIAETDGCGYLHPGDIPHHIFSGNKFYDPADLLSIWEDSKGVAAWLLVDPRFRSYDAQFRPDLRGGKFERDIVELAFGLTVEKMRTYDIKSDCVLEEVFRCDTGRIKILEELGWECTEKPAYVLNRTRIADVPEPIVPDGYSMRSVKGTEEAAAVAKVHAASFNTDWPPELYKRYMEAPGYSPEREYVVVAPDGSFAAFTVTWHDKLNRTGHFEPVGTHKDHRRKGLGLGVIRHALRQMVEAGMEYATVVNENDNEAAKKLYYACGFKPRYELDGYAKPISDADSK